MLGSGTQLDPFIVADVYDLQDINNDLDAYYELGNNIDASETETWNSEAGFAPIGSSSTRFTGYIDGKGFEISNLHINRPNTDYIGLIAYSEGAELKNIGIISPTIRGKHYTGPFVGYVYYGSFSKIYAKEIDIDLSEYGGYYTGGLFGYSNYVTMSNSFATGSIVAKEDAGGLSYHFYESEVSNCYARVNITCTSTGFYSGGFVAYHGSTDIISNCYSTGSVIHSAPDTGGFCGRSNDPSKLTDCFWDIETSGMATSPGGTGKTTAEMKDINTFLSWDISGTLDKTTNDGYPFLGFEVGEDDTWLLYPIRLKLNRKLSSQQESSFSTLRKFVIGYGKATRDIKNLIYTSSTYRRLVSDMTFYKKSLRDLRIPLPTKLFKTQRDFGCGYDGTLVRRRGSVLGLELGFNVQRGLLTITGTSSEVTLDTPVPVGHSFVISSARGTVTSPVSSTARVELIDVVGDSYTKIRATRNTASGTCYVEWQVIYDDSFTVQSGTIACNAAFKNIDISSVDLSKSFIVLSASSSSSTAYRSFARGKFNSSTQIEVRKGDTSTSYYPTVCWYVVEWEGASVQSGLVTNSSQTNTASISAVDLSNSFLSYTHYNTTTSTQSAQAFVRGRFTSTAQVQFMRGVSTDTAYVSYFVVSHPNISVQSGLLTVSGTSGTQTIDSVNISNSFMPAPNTGNAYQTSTGTSTLHHGYNTHKLWQDNITIERGNSTGDLYSSWFVVCGLYGYIPIPKFSTVRKLSSFLTEPKSTLRRLAIEIPTKFFSTARYFGAYVLGKTVRRLSTEISSYAMDRLYRSKIVITEVAGGDYNNYPTLIDIPFVGRMNNDFSDILFTESDGKTLIPFGLRSKTDGVTAKFVLKRNYTAHNSQDIYIYYGNSTATSSAVAAATYRSWVYDWYNNNMHGKPSAAYTNTTCTSYGHTITGTIPSWAGDVMFVRGSGADGYEYRTIAYYGRIGINGTTSAHGVPWASTAVCFGVVTETLDSYGASYYIAESLNHAMWVRGGSNTVYFGHYQGPYAGLRFSWYPVDPDISILSEESYSGFSTVRRLGSVIIEPFKTLRNSTIFTDFLGSTVRLTYIALARVKTIRSIQKINYSSFSSVRRRANNVVNSVSTLRKPSISFGRFFGTSRLFSFAWVAKTLRSITWSLAQPKRYTYTYKGAWVSTTSYTKGDIVYYSNKTYKAKVNNSNHIPTETDYWEYLYDGQHKFIIPEDCNYVDVLVVAGGGGGGGYVKYVFGSGSSGGGGAGGLVFIENYSIAKYVDNVSVTVGNVGAGGPSGSSGGNSSFGDLLAIGGGGGRRDAAGLDGGSGGGGGSGPNGSKPGGVSTQTTTNDGYAGTGFGTDGTTFYGGGAGSSGSAGSNGKSIWGVTYAIGGRSGDNYNQPANTGNGGDSYNSGPSGGSGWSGGSGIVIVKYENNPYFQTNRRLGNYAQSVFKTLRFPSIITSYLFKTLRLFRAEFFGSTYRFGINLINSPMKTVRRLSSDITTEFSTVRRLSTFAGYTFKTLRLFSFVSNFIANRVVVIMNIYKGTTKRRLSSSFVQETKTVRFPQIFYVWLGSTFRRVGELAIDLINRIKFPPRE